MLMNEKDIVDKRLKFKLANQGMNILDIDTDEYSHRLQLKLESKQKDN